MIKIIYTMTTDLKDNFNISNLKKVGDTLMIINNLSTDDYNKLNINFIKDDIESYYNELLEIKTQNLYTIDSLMHFYYPNLISYNIIYEDNIPTGEIEVCLP